MKLWIIIDQLQYDYLQKYGYLRSNPKKIWPEFKLSYNWLTNQMHEKLDYAPNNVIYPIWAWLQWEGESRKKPDIRALRYVCGAGIFYRIELDIHEDRIVLSNFIDWHSVLNKTYLPFFEKEDKEFDLLLSNNNVKYGDWDNYSFTIRDIVITSWNRIFDFTSNREYNYVGKIKDREIQATFWILYDTDIIKIDKFKSIEIKK